MTADHTAAPQKAAALFEMGRPHLAIPILHGALRDTPNDGVVLSWLARALQLSGALGDALRASEQAVAADPELAIAHMVRADVLFDHGQLHAAIDAARLAVELDPWDPDTMTTLVHYFSWAGEGDAAAEVAERAVTQFPEDPEVWNARCMSEWALGQSALAERSARRALALDPSRAAYHNNVAWSLVLQREFHAALPSFRRAAELTRPPEFWFMNLAFCLRAVGDDAEAARVERLGTDAMLAYVDERLRKRPSSSRLFYERGIFRRLQGQDADALTDFEDALLYAETPAEELAAQRFIVAQEVALGRDDEARRDAASLLRFGDVDWVACSTVAHIGWLTSDLALSRAGLDAAGRLVEAPMFAAQAAGYLALAEARWDDAIDMLELAIRRGASHFTCCEHAGLALARYNAGDTAASREAFRLAGWMAPRCVTVVRLQATLAA